MPARTRTKRRSPLPPLQLSTLLPSHYNLRPDEANAVACPDCQTWQRIMGDQGKTRTIRDHYSTDLSGAELDAGQRDTRCPSARRIVEIDVTIAHWARQIEEGTTQVAARRPTTLLRKVPTPQPVALHQLNPAPPTADSARTRFEAHRARCADCIASKACPTGLRLEGEARVLRYREPQRAAAQARAEQEQRLAERRQAEDRPERRQAEWSGVLLPVFVADALRRIPLHGARSPILGAQVPVGARPIARTRTADEVLAASPLRTQRGRSSTPGSLSV
ncbi:hypothetical protein PUR61_03340 [Streptomyces sp. BE20]|uniref:hypothetical protein n=1 Tax=Streptomyces sp. BE20 TaxID=3002525 RepID=UPI002E779006|nr:hypothetical protein [Streptomyces sp. BE20]MEE1821237.1 hypothetical protein [Streptomyces sp. BE20]